jgi:starvation-inducible DNA-binding protein
MNNHIIDHTHIGIPLENREKVGHLLNVLLADEMVLFVKTKNFHWNVTGLHFQELHKFFDEQASILLPIIDEVAERARALEIAAAGSLNEYTTLSRLKEHAGQQIPESTMLSELLSNHEAIIRALRSDLRTCLELGDEGTADFLTGLMEIHEKSAWMYRSFIT